MAFLFGVGSTKSAAATGNVSIGRLDCRVGFRSSSPRIFSKTSGAHEICTADLASTLVLWTRSGYAWSTKRSSEKSWSEYVQNLASPAISTLPRSVGFRTTIRFSTASSRAALDGSIFSARNIFSKSRKRWWSRPRS